MTALPRRACPTIAAAGPIAGANRWQQVVGAAGGRCQCVGGCGRNHHDGHGRCPREDTSSSPLHAVPRAAAAGTVAGMRMDAEALMALCDTCHGRLLRLRRNTGRQGAEADHGQEGLW